MKIKILEVSACGNRQSEKKLRFIGNMDERIIFMFKKLMQKDSYDLVSVRDIPYHALKRLQVEMEGLGYRMYMHKCFEDVKEKWRYTCLSVLFVSPSIEFEQIYTSDKFESIVRYVAGIITVPDKEKETEKIYYKTSHFPCVNTSRSHIEHQILRKVTMLEDEVKFQEEHNDSLAICAGDYNVDYNTACDGEDITDDGYYGKQEFEQLIFRDTVLGDTYEDRTLDHVFISEGLANSRIKVKTEVFEDYYMYLTDHKIIGITLTA